MSNIGNDESNKSVHDLELKDKGDIENNDIPESSCKLRTVILNFCKRIKHCILPISNSNSSVLPPYDSNPIVSEVSSRDETGVCLTTTITYEDGKTCTTKIYTPSVMIEKFKELEAKRSKDQQNNIKSQ